MRSGLVFSTVVLVLLANTGHAQTSPLFQCQPSSDQSGQVFTPNIPDFYFNHENAANFLTGDELTGEELTVSAEERGTTFILTIPPLSNLRNCSGPVVSLQYCYETRDRVIGDNRNVFDLLSLARDGFEIRVTDSIEVRASPQENTCSTPTDSDSRVVCCDNISVTDNFQISSSNFTFGVALTGSSIIRLLTFAGSAAEYSFEQFQTMEFDRSGPDVGESVTISNEERNIIPLLLLRFFIDPDDLVTTLTTTDTLATSTISTATSVTTTTRVPATATGVPATTTGIPATTTGISATATGVPATAPATTTGATGVPATALAGQTPEPSTIAPAVLSEGLIAGVAAGGGALGVLLLVLAIVMAVVFVTRKYLKNGSATNDENEYEIMNLEDTSKEHGTVQVSPNQAYGVVRDQVQEDGDHYDAIDTANTSRVHETIANETHTDSVRVSSNQAYGVTSAKGQEGDEYDTIDPTNTNRAREIITSAKEQEDQYDYI